MTENLFGKNVRTYRDVLIRRSSVGDNTIIADDAFVTDSILGTNVTIERRTQLFNSEIGNYSTIGVNSMVRYASIGRFCSLAWNVSVGGAEHNIKRISSHLFPDDKRYGLINSKSSIDHYPDGGGYNVYCQPVRILNDVWVAAGAQILRGITISDGSVIGAGAVVTRNIGPYEIWAGVPAKKIGQRFTDEIISDLIEIRWWDFSDDVIRENIHLFQEELTSGKIAELKELRLKNEYEISVKKNKLNEQ